MIILIDAEEFIPTKCSGCKFFARIKGRANGDPTDVYINGCIALRQAVPNVSNRLPECPIKYMPARFRPSQREGKDLEEAYQFGLADGWNSCIDAIERD